MKAINNVRNYLKNYKETGKFNYEVSDFIILILLIIHGILFFLLLDNLSACYSFYIQNDVTSGMPYYIFEIFSKLWKYPFFVMMIIALLGAIIFIISRKMENEKKYIFITSYIALSNFFLFLVIYDFLLIETYPFRGLLR